MKVVGLVAENIKKLRAIEIVPNGAMVKITGANEQGKSSVMDALWWGLAGKSAMDPEPIRKGAKKALMRIDLGEMVVTRTLRAKEGGEFTQSIHVVNAEGVEYDRPESVLNALLGRFTFDPLKFMRMKPEEQFDSLKSLVPGFDFENAAREDARDYANRTDANREAKRSRTLADGISLPPGARSLKRIDVEEGTQAILAAAKTNAEIETRRTNRERLAEDADGKRDEIEKLEARIATLRAEAEEIDKRLAEAEPLPARVDVEALTREITEAQQTNDIVALREQQAAHEAEASQYEERSEDLTKAMADRQAAREAAIAAVKMPVEGLGFGEGIVTLKGVPFEQGSDAEKLRASIGIAMALNPDLRIIRVREGSLLDKNSLALVQQMAEERDYQVWIELVDTTGKIGFVIEDGEVVHEEQPEKPAKATKR